jgi:hypothetical protein
MLKVEWDELKKVSHGLEVCMYCGLKASRMWTISAAQMERNAAHDGAVGEFVVLYGSKH